VAEGGVATINVTRTGGTAAASINYVTLDGSASSAGSTPDYTGAAGTLNFDAGQTTASFTVSALTDMMLEPPETVNLVLFGGNVASNPSLLTINDVPPTPGTTPGPTSTSPSVFEFSQSNYTVAEGGVATINVTRTGGTAAASINYATLDGSASPADYTGAAGVLNFGAGETTASFTVATVRDTIEEPPETVILVLTGGFVGNPSLVTILDGPTGPTPAPLPAPLPAPMLSSPSLFQFAQPNYIDPSFVAPTSFFYGSSPDPIIDGGPGVVTINRTGNTSVPPSVDYLIAGPGGGQPVNNLDYTIVCLFPVCPTGDTVNFNSGQTSVSLTMNNPPNLTGGVVNLGFGPGANIASPPNTQITLL
jgi:hypothetical protein